MLLTLLIFAISLALLVKGADVVVDEVTSLARFLKISPFVIGLTVIAVGTSFPELVTSLFSASQGTPEIGLGNILGSNIFNLGINMALGFFLLAAPFRKKLFQTNTAFLFVVTALFFVLSLDGSISSIEGLSFLVLFACYFLYLLKTTPRSVEKEFATYTAERQRRWLSYPFFSQLGYLALGLVALIFGARFLISSILQLSAQIGLSEKLISITLVAFGTALPELFVTINATRKGLTDVFVGNIVGSNLANILLILGLTSLVVPLPLTSFDLFFGLPLLLLMTGLVVHFLFSQRATQFFTGFLLLVFYALFLIGLFLFSHAV